MECIAFNNHTPQYPRMRGVLAAVLAVLAVLLLIGSADAFSVRHITAKSRSQSSSSRLNAASGPTLDDRTRDRLDQLVKSNTVLLFMKGNKIFPQWCVAWRAMEMRQLCFLLTTCSLLLSYLMQWVQQHGVPHP